MLRPAEAGFGGQVHAVVQKARHVTLVHYRDVTGSTNEDALALARAGAPHGTIVVADAQKSGRGRQGRAWQSPPGKGLWMSWILRPNLPLDRSFWISAAAGVALAETAARTAGARATLRWPNDVMAGTGRSRTAQRPRQTSTAPGQAAIARNMHAETPAAPTAEGHRSSGGRKLAGILTETSGSSERLEFIVLGIGLNVNQVETDFDPAFAAEATSLRMLGGHELDRSLVLAAFIEAFEFLYRNLERDQGRTIRGEWLALCPMIGKRVSVAGPGLDFEATATGLADDGALIVDPDGGSPVEVRAADVRLLRELE